MALAADNALIVQSDCSVLLEVRAPRADEARAALAPFAELVKSPEHVHTYRLTPLSIWNARAAGLAAERMVEALREHARYVVPPNVEQEILDLAARYGIVRIRVGDPVPDGDEQAEARRRRQGAEAVHQFCHFAARETPNVLASDGRDHLEQFILDRVDELLVALEERIEVIFDIGW